MSWEVSQGEYREERGLSASTITDDDELSTHRVSSFAISEALEHELPSHHILRHFRCMMGTDGVLVLVVVKKIWSQKLLFMIHFCLYERQALFVATQVEVMSGRYRNV